MNKQQPIYDAIYLSPHLDDVALSCAGHVWQRTAAGERILVATIMAGDPPQAPLSPFAQLLHERWQLAADVVAARRAEDMIACQIMAADWRHAPIPDCIYRRHAKTGAPLYPSVEAIFDIVHPAEDALGLEIGAWLKRLPPAKEWVIPLSVGNHVDHQLTRSAAETAANLPLCYYEDYPYAQKAGALALVVNSPGHWQVKVVPLTAAAIQCRFQAVAAFISQVNSFFVDQADLERQIGSYIEQVGGERYWQSVEE